MALQDSLNCRQTPLSLSQTKPLSFPAPVVFAFEIIVPETEFLSPECRGSTTESLEIQQNQPAGLCKYNQTFHSAHQPTQSQLRFPTQFCDNQFCGQTQGLNKSRQTKGRLLCTACCKLFKEGCYCDFCNQIYTPSRQFPDGKTWEACKLCVRFRHKQCLERASGPLPQLKCLKCALLGRRRKQPKTEQDRIKDAERFKLSQSLDSVNLFGRGGQQPFRVLDDFLGGAGSRPHLNEEQMRQDAEKLGPLILKCLRERP